MYSISPSLWIRRIFIRCVFGNMGLCIWKNKGMKLNLEAVEFCLYGYNSLLSIISLYGLFHTPHKFYDFFHEKRLWQPLSFLLKESHLQPILQVHPDLHLWYSSQLFQRHRQRPTDILPIVPPPAVRLHTCLVVILARSWVCWRSLLSWAFICGAVNKVIPHNIRAAEAENKNFLCFYKS